MLEPIAPANEQQRLLALARYEILDTAPELAYDEVVALAAQLCQVPISLVSLVDADRQWFKARVGLGAPETPRAVSFCGHAVGSGEMLVVPDATRDARFADNPLVTSEPHVVFYAGAPLRTDDGFDLGTLCVIDHQPRELSDTQLRSLRALSRVVMRQLELGRLLRAQDERALELQRAVEIAQEASRAKSAFLAHMSHELRTPLNSVIGFTAVLRKNQPGNLTEKQTRYLERIEDNGRDLLELIDDLLDLSKVEAGAVGLRPEELDLGKLVRAALRRCELVIEQSSCQLDVAIPEGLDPVRGDRRRLGQVLTNLITNAAKFAAGGTIRVRVAVAADAPSRAVRIDVTDDGVGIAHEHLALVFEPFRQVSEGATRHFGGTGLGLAISSAVAEVHGFELRVASVLGEGSTFSLVFDPDAPAVDHVAPTPPG